jgi:hypothetical protein
MGRFARRRHCRVQRIDLKQYALQVLRDGAEQRKYGQKKAILFNAIRPYW